MEFNSSRNISNQRRYIILVENYKKYIIDKSAETGFITSTFEKADKLLDILEWINGNKELKDLLVLKGGTAINTAIFSFPRLSVDIDFDININFSNYLYSFFAILQYYEMKKCKFMK